ncbi:MAG: hypothetical protein Q7Q71_13715 [Verrucomicrobiota bacterium JB023]|nr:hypothetical protein [Verrucomicrobiota bacterium JB023]
MAKLLQTSVPALAAMFWGGATVWLYSSGRLADFLIPKFHLLAFLGGMGMLVLGLFVLLSGKEPEGCGHDHDHGDDHDHHHDQSPLTLILLMILPVGAALAADTSKGYSLDVLERKGLYNNRAALANAYDIPKFTREMLEESTPQSADGRYQLPVGQIFFSAGDSGMMEVFDGLAVETEGQIIAERDNNSDGRRLRLYRTVMTCCAADALVLGFPLEFEDVAPRLEERSWVKIGGTLTYEETPDGPFPLFQVERVDPIESPDFMELGF